MYRIIVVGTDGSERANRAVAFAVSLAEQTDATLHVIHAYQGTRDPIVHAARAVVEQLAVDFDDHTERMRTHAIQGDPVDAILNYAYDANADLIVVGNRGMSGKGRFLGSVPNAIAHDARCSVMIVPTDKL